MNQLLFLLPAFVSCLILTGIHTYLGIHVISRGVIFVDIALAQLAALGMTVAFFFGFEHDTQAAYFFALGFTIFGAVFFSLFRDRHLPQEAVIGVTFAVSSALVVLLSDRISHGAEHLKYVLTGNILWVEWSQIVKIFAIYALLGLFHYLFREKFLLVSQDPAAAERRGLSVPLWDFLFYLSFGLVITSSVQVGGILLVFSFLIVPALCAMLFFSSLKGRLGFGWIVGIGASLAGLAISYAVDTPTGATIVSCFGCLLILCWLARSISGSRNNN